MVIIIIMKIILITEQYFRREVKISFIDLMYNNMYDNESIDDYLKCFKQMKVRCYTQIPEKEWVKMAILRLAFSIRMKVVNFQEEI